MSQEPKSFADPVAEAERASHDLPDQIARARERVDRFRDAMERLGERRSAVAEQSGSDA